MPFLNADFMSKNITIIKNIYKLHTSEKSQRIKKTNY